MYGGCLEEEDKYWDKHGKTFYSEKKTRMSNWLNTGFNIVTVMQIILKVKYNKIKNQLPVNYLCYINSANDWMQEHLTWVMDFTAWIKMSSTNITLNCLHFYISNVSMVTADVN